MKNKLKPLALVVVFIAILVNAARAESEWIDTNGDGSTDTLQLDPFVVDGNDPDTFDDAGFMDWCDQNGFDNPPTPDDFDSYEDFWDWVDAPASVDNTSPASSGTSLTGNSPPSGHVNATSLRNQLSYDPNGRGENANALLNPIDALTARSLADEAWSITKQLYPGVIPHNNEADAFRHAYWSFRMAQELGTETAKQFTDAHEVSNPNVESELLMDLWNNKQGRDLFDHNSNADAKTVVQDAIRGGEIQIVPFVVTPGT